MNTLQPDTSPASRGVTYSKDSELLLDHYSRTIFRSLRRIDQRKCALSYLKGLLVTPGKKSVRRLATAVSCDPSAVQSLRQFVSLSPWDFDEVMEELTQWVADLQPDPVWSIGRAVLPKRGHRSVGVHRYFDLNSGRTRNCQLGLGSFLSVGTAQVPVDWRLHLPASWTQDPQRRKDARVPDAEKYRPLWAQTLRLVDRLSARTGSTSPVVLVDMSDEPDVGNLLHGLAKRRRDFVVAVPPRLAVLPAGETTSSATSARGLIAAQGAEMALISPTGGQRRIAHLQTSLVRLPGGSQRRGPGTPYRLFTEAGRARASHPLWLTSLTHHSLTEVASIAALQAGTAEAIGAMEQHFGLLDFEGRSFHGWYHHMALVSAAYTYWRLHVLPPVPIRRDAQPVL